MDRFLKLFLTIRVLNGLVSESVSTDAYNKYGRPAIEIMTHYEAEDRTVESVFLNEIKQANQEQMFYQADASRCNMEDGFNVSVQLCRRITAGTMVVLGTHKYASIEVFKSYSSVSQVPFVTTGIAQNTTGQELEYTIYLRPLYAKAIADIAKHFGWTELFYIYSTNDGLKRWEQLAEALEINRQVLKMSLQLVRNASDALIELQRLDKKSKDLRPKHILLDLPATECSHILQEQFNRKTGLSHDYVIVNLIDLDYDLGGRGGMNVIAFSLTTQDANSIKQIRDAYINMNQDLTKELQDAALAADAAKVITEGIKRAAAMTPSMANYSLIEGGVSEERPDCLNDSIQPFPYGRQLIKAIKEVEINGLTGKVKFNKFGLRCDYQLHLLHSTAIGGLSKIGHWHSESGLHIDHVGLSGSKVDRHLIVTSLLSIPYLGLKRDASLTGNERFEGYMVDLIEQVSTIVGFKYTINVVKDSKFGARDESTGSWNGMIGEIMRNEADIAAAALTVTSEREKVVDFTRPFMTSGLSVIMKRSTAYGNRYPSFLSYFSAEIWVCVLASYLATCIVHLIVTCMDGCRVESKENERVSWRKSIALDSLFFCFSTFRQQHKRPKSTAGRIATVSWSMLVLFLTCFYTAQMINVLFKERPSKISTVEELSRQTTIKYGTLRTGSAIEFFRRSTVPTYEKMWSVMRTAEPSVFVNTTEEGVQRIRQNDKYAFITDSSTIEFVNSLPPCDTVKVGENLDSKGFGFATKQGSPLRDSLDMALTVLNERQELLRLKKKWFGRSSSCGSSNKSNAKIHQKFGIFYCLLCALGVALSILVCEYLKKNCKKDGLKKDISAPDEDEQRCSQL